LPRHDDADGDLSQGFEYEDPEELEEEEIDPALADLDPDTRAAVEKVISERTNQFKSAYGSRVSGLVGELRGMGLDVTENGVTVRNPALLAPMVAPFFGAPGGQGAGQGAAPKEEEAAAPPQMPDPYTEPEKFAEWVEGIADRRSQAARSEIQELRGMLGSQSMGGILATAAEVLPEVGLGDLVEMPGFQEALEDGFKRLGTPAKDWTDPDMIARVAGVINPDLRKAQKARRTADEDPLGIFGNQQRQPRRQAPAPQEPPARQQAQSQVQRRSLTQIGASGGGERPGRTAGYDERTLKIAQRLGMKPAEVAALQDDSGVAYRRLQQSQQRRPR
jgi:hypothetical protein